MQPFDTAASTDSAPVIRPLPPICGGSDADPGDTAGADAAAVGVDAQGQPTDSPAGAQNTGLNGQPADNVPFHKHPRWIERERQWNERLSSVDRENRGLKGQVAELAQWRQQMEATAQRQGGLTPAQMQDYQKAGDAIEMVLRQHPRLAKLLELAERAPQMFEATQGVAELGRAQERAIHQQARGSLATLVKAESLPTDTKTLGFIEDLVAAQIARMPEGQQRYLAGDSAVLKEAFDEIKSAFLGQLRRESTQRTIDAKTNLRNLPPRPGGGTPGQTPPPKLVPGKEREYMRSLSERAATILQGGAGS